MKDGGVEIRGMKESMEKRRKKEKENKKMEK